MAGPEGGQILALSGGGFRGLYTASVIEQLEAHTNVPFGRHFDLIAGTSIGGVIALALAMEKPASAIVQLFTEHGALIFKKRSWGYRRSRFSPDTLRRVLEGVFGDATLADCVHPVVIPAVNYSSGKPQMFKTPHDPRLTQDGRLRLVDVALATSAAPTYFPRHAMIEQQFVDGGLVANAPGLIALHESEIYLDLLPAQTRLLSIGTLSVPTDADPTANHEGGAVDWGRGSFLKTIGVTKRLFNLTISANEQMVDFMLRHRLGDRYRVVNELVADPTQAALIGLEKTGEGARKVLRTHAHQSVRQLQGDRSFDPWLVYQAKVHRFNPVPLDQKEVRHA
ncbi:CBASS cGAMP-activated phospholipase [Luteibacter sp. 9135]|uniref:CBASS cGAMP-activated phospholipase n=1 Tax=Luteibacter sp. 9135 TaxID=1500893 RepID=UPI00068BF9A1|nr:CBASS cGAMP-activated phospholipase [Luteibacter sp. 9135]